MSPSIVPRHLDPENVRIGETLRAYREIQGIKVGELANRVVMSSSYLSNIEAGRKRLTPRLAELVAEALNIRLAALVRSDFYDEEVAA